MYSTKEVLTSSGALPYIVFAKKTLSFQDCLVRLERGVTLAWKNVTVKTSVKKIKLSCFRSWPSLWKASFPHICLSHICSMAASTCRSVINKTWEHFINRHYPHSLISFVRVSCCLWWSVCQISVGPSNFEPHCQTIADKILNPKSVFSDLIICVI